MVYVNQFTYPTTEARFWAKVDKSGGEDACWMWLGGKDKDGYGKILTYGKHNRAHRFAWEIENGEIENQMQVLHSCDEPKCVNSRHLFLGTNIDNVRDRDLKGRTYHPKLNELQVRIIRRCEKKLLSKKYLASVFGTGMTIIGNIRNGYKWKRV